MLRTLAVLLLLAIAAGLTAWLMAPRVYDGQGEVLYSDRDGTYQLVLAWPNDRYEPAYQVHQSAELDGQYRFPSRLYINHTDSGADAGQLFLKKVERVTTELLQPEDNPSPMRCTQPSEEDSSPGAALVTYLDFTGRSGACQLLWTLYLSNGDVIRLRQDEIIEPIQTYDYYPSDTPMDTLEELQALVDQIADTVEPSAVVNLHLPPLVYEGSLVMEARPINLYGSTEGGRQTTFTGTLRVASQDSWITYVDGIDFAGSGDGVGISTSARLWASNCRFTGWKTGLLGYGYAWINATDCQFEGNEVGLHFNSTGDSVSHTKFGGNRFQGNGTAVLLEQVPTDVTINFVDSIFLQNDTDIDNRCDQPLDISQAQFQ